MWISGRMLSEHGERVANDDKPNCGDGGADRRSAKPCAVLAFSSLGTLEDSGVADLGPSSRAANCFASSFHSSSRPCFNVDAVFVSMLIPCL